jgi:hypothetical protein
MKGKLIAGVFVAAIAAGGAFYSGSAMAGTQADAGQQRAISNLESAKGSWLASERLVALKANRTDMASIKADTPAANWFTRVKSSEVNMATNRFEAKRQGEFTINGKTFYGSDGAAQTMAKNSSTCFAKDPLTGASVNKAEAVIYADASGRVYYFQSEHTFKGLLSLATPDTIYGYSAK